MRILMLYTWLRQSCGRADDDRGLDNAGKTTIVKRIMQEDVTTVSPTLGFIIKTIDYNGYVSFYSAQRRILTQRNQLQTQHLYVFYRFRPNTIN